MTAARVLSRAILVLATALFVAIAWLTLIADPRWSSALLVGDDAGYYLAIARNACLGYGPSFDRVHATNGFNPLLTLILVALDFLLVPGKSLVGCYRLGVGVSLAALLVGLFALVRIVRRFIDPAVFAGDIRNLVVAAAVAFYTFFLALKQQFGMDASLVLAIMGVYLDRALRGGLLAPGWRSAIADGVLLGLLVLARVDSLPFLVAALAVMAVQASGRPGAWGALGARALTAGLMVLPYIVWSTRRFGTWMPVSARIKSSFPHVDLARSLAVIRHTSLNSADTLSFLVAFLGAGAVLLITLRWALTGRLRECLADPRRALMVVLAGYIAMRLTYMLFFSRTDVQGGYVMPAHLFNLLAFFAAVEAIARRAGNRAPRVAAAAAVSLIVVSVGLLAGRTAVARSRLAAIATGDEWTVAQRIRDATTNTDVLYGGAFGLIGYLADRAWINGDGVANTADYQDAFFEPDGLRRWLGAAGVTHVVYAAPANAPEPRSMVRLDVVGALAGRSNTIEVDPRRAVLMGQLARGFDRAHPGSKIYLARWTP